jgi:hypothetical protein
MAIVWSEMCRHALVDVPLPALLNKLYAVGGILARPSQHLVLLCHSLFILLPHRFAALLCLLP